MIGLSGAERRRISAELVELYQSGLSLKELVSRTGKPQTTVRTILLRAGIELRPAVSVPFAQALRESGKRNILPYFGFCYFQGKVVPDQREYVHLQAMYSLWKKGMNPNAIANHLNSKKVPPRSASAWNRNSVVNILKRFESGVISLKNGQLELAKNSKQLKRGQS